MIRRAPTAMTVMVPPVSIKSRHPTSHLSSTTRTNIRIAITYTTFPPATASKKPLSVMKTYLILITTLLSTAFGLPNENHHHGFAPDTPIPDSVPPTASPTPNISSSEMLPLGKRQDDKEKHVNYIAHCRSGPRIVFYADFSKSYDWTNHPTFFETYIYGGETFQLAEGSGHQDSGFHADFRDLAWQWYKKDAAVPVGSAKDRDGDLDCYKDTGRLLFAEAQPNGGEICEARYFCWQKSRGTVRLVSVCRLRRNFKRSNDEQPKTTKPGIVSVPLYDNVV
ncbi:uncharacterized protein BDZ99DRAFT_503988 [Mytilinidion resinicola]|uniref:Uncharacterized protein n=1 Tax=Mytilinidion resinicola TaxID=574789 RepID=A0A6A6Y1X5_9PEZI|nr:uncharacterized protein BDZ99DRAFT_503988 [Mytilinidion resinicola]KAF2802225.1 hypothetical protein BDZ99DRAFT_503988 [Mytilinidion resinicola]